jgi:hypothetical protein
MTIKSATQRVLLSLRSLVNVDVTAPDTVATVLCALVAAIWKSWADEVRGHLYTVRGKMRPP